jgi:hypothetical protein
MSNRFVTSCIPIIIAIEVPKTQMALIAKSTKKMPVMMAEKELRIIQSFISSSSLTSFESFVRIKKKLDEKSQSTDDTQK